MNNRWKNCKKVFLLFLKLLLSIITSELMVMIDTIEQISHGNVMFLKAHNIKVFSQCKKMEDSAIAYTGRCKTSEMAVRLRLKVFFRINCHFSRI